MNWLILLIGILLGIIIWQDLKYRTVHVLAIIGIAALGLIIGYQSLGEIILRIAGLNLLFVTISVTMMVVYISLRAKVFKNPFMSYFGLGDLLFFFAIAPIFLSLHYIIFFIAGLLFSITMHFFFKDKTESIPLAGYVSILLIFCLIWDCFTGNQKITLLFL